MSGIRWLREQVDGKLVEALVRALGVHPVIATLLVIRGVRDEESAASFLSSGVDAISSPDVFRDMKCAVDRVREAINAGERIVIFGDYDVDGVTGSALLFHVLSGLGARVEVYIPNRLTEGYGINAGALDRIRMDGSTVVISVDCGIGALGEAEHARSIGLDLIITDHHEFHQQSADSQHGSRACLPSAYAILHPRLLRQDVSERMGEHVAHLTGVGVAFKFAQALYDASASEERLRSLLDLVALGTVADVGRLTGENRVLVKRGLEILSQPDQMLRPGLAALKQVCGLQGKDVGVGTLGFTLAPRINASGRLESAFESFLLLTTDSAQDALAGAQALDAVNRERQEVEARILLEAREQALAHEPASCGALVLASANWHPGVIGIVASRIAEEFYRPTALISIKDGVGKGSARSIRGFDLHAGLSACEELLLGYGGHKYAAGFSMREAAIPLLRQRLSEIALARMGQDGFIRTLSVDCPLMLDEVTHDLVQAIHNLGPFGNGNPEPRLGLRRLSVLSVRVLGEKHLKFRVRQDSGRPIDAIAFHLAEKYAHIVTPGSVLAVVCTPKVNTWNGTSSIQLDVKDIKREAHTEKTKTGR